MNIKIVPSGRIDWCGDCKAEHGYDCPKDKQNTQTVLQEIQEEIEKLPADIYTGLVDVRKVLAIISSRMK